MNKNEFQVLLYYKYTDIKNPVEIKKQQRLLCSELNLKGRIIIAEEGINGTVEGTIENTTKYMQAMHDSDIFSDISFKKSIGTGNAFLRLSIKVRDEIVTSQVSNLNPNKVTGQYITADQLHDWFEKKIEFYIVDMRNGYEQLSGFFEQSILSEFANFRNLPEILPKLGHLKNKTIVTVCTGGVRCEKASGFLISNGFSDVYQLLGGIQTYMEKYPNQHFKGKLYVFDNRLTIGFNIQDPSHEIVGRCKHCGSSCDSYVNCMNHVCHLHYICCENCLDPQTRMAYCSPSCKQLSYVQ